MTAPATPEEVLDFCNRVREAIGLGRIPSLAPSVPGDGGCCLIARNVGVWAEVDADGNGAWHLTLDAETRVSKGLGLPVEGSRIKLPHSIGLAAEAFDLGAPEFADLVDTET